MGYSPVVFRVISAVVDGVFSRDRAAMVNGVLCTDY
jgi:hypothetical protein